MDTKKKSSWCCSLPATVLCGQVVMLRECIMHSGKIYSRSCLSSFHHPRGYSPGCFCGLEVREAAGLQLKSHWLQSLESNGKIWGLKIKGEYFPFIRYMCKSSSGTAQRPTGREEGCSGEALMCECVEINQCENGILDSDGRTCIFSKSSKKEEQ